MSKEITNEEWQMLKRPFAAEDVHFRVGQKTKDGNKATALAYIKADAITDRLDEVLSPGGWQVRYSTNAVPAKDDNGVDLWGTKCFLSIKDGGEWITKEDVGTPGGFEAIKSSNSDALKRAAACWGIGRYLKAYRPVWCPIDQYGNFTGSGPRLPPELLPSSSVQGNTNRSYEQFASIPAQPQTQVQAQAQPVASAQQAEAQPIESNEIRWPRVPMENVSDHDQSVLSTVFEQLAKYPATKGEALEFVKGNQTLTNDGRAFGSEYIELNF